MATNRENFEFWYVKTLERLYPVRDAGFPILMIVFPILERYLRQKLKIGDSKLPDIFFGELCKMFPELGDQKSARDFWQIFRNGILHEIALSKKTRSGSSMPVGWLSHDFSQAIQFDRKKHIYLLDPVKFAKQVVDQVLADFVTLDDVTLTGTAMPQVMIFPNVTSTGTGSFASQPIVLGTSSKP